MQIEILPDLAAWREIASDWNQLWQRSGSHIANHRSELLELFARTFSADVPFRAVTVRSAGRLVAGLPLLARRRGSWPASRWQSVANEWAPQGCLLLDGQVDPQRTIEALATGAQRQSGWGLSLDWLPMNLPASQALAECYRRNGWSIWERPRYEVPAIPVPPDFDHWFQSLSKNRRRKHHQAERRLAEIGPVDVVEIDGKQPPQLERALAQAFEIESAGWKGQSGSAMACSESIRNYFSLWSQELARAGLFRMYQLTLGGRPVAFDMGYLAGRVYSSFKISYLPEFAACSPGQVLNVRVIGELSRQGSADLIDCVGPLSKNGVRWSDRNYVVSRLLLSNGSGLGNGAVRAISTVATLLGKGGQGHLSANAES